MALVASRARKLARGAGASSGYGILVAELLTWKRLKRPWSACRSEHFYFEALIGVLSQRVMKTVSAVKICASGRHVSCMTFGARTASVSRDNTTQTERPQAYLWGGAVGVAGGIDVVADEAVPVPAGVGLVVDGQQARAVGGRAVGGPDWLRVQSQGIQLCSPGVIMWSTNCAPGPD